MCKTFLNMGDKMFWTFRTNSCWPLSFTLKSEIFYYTYKRPRLCALQPRCLQVTGVLQVNIAELALSARNKISCTTIFSENSRSPSIIIFLSKNIFNEFSAGILKQGYREGVFRVHHTFHTSMRVKQRATHFILLILTHNLHTSHPSLETPSWIRITRCTYTLQ